MVLRVLDQNRGVPPLEELGFLAGALNDLKGFLKHQHGMILVVGPTGSGKSTTLCSALMSMQSERTNIITIEDPDRIPAARHQPDAGPTRRSS
jgi:type IV pilus assembly protein PilB